MGPDGLKEFIRDPCLAWLAATGVNTAWGALAAECGPEEPMAAEGGEGLFFSSCIFTT